MPVPSNSDRGWLLNRGTIAKITCEVASITRPTIVWKKDRIISTVEELFEIPNPQSGGTNLWGISITIPPLENSGAAQYICEAKFGSEIVQSRTLNLNIQGMFQPIEI